MILSCDAAHQNEEPNRNYIGPISHFITLISHVLCCFYLLFEETGLSVTQCTKNNMANIDYHDYDMSHM